MGLNAVSSKPRRRKRVNGESRHQRKWKSAAWGKEFGLCVSLGAPRMRVWSFVFVTIDILHHSNVSWFRDMSSQQSQTQQHWRRSKESAVKCEKHRWEPDHA